jgi:hypothetical protein
VDTHAHEEAQMPELNHTIVPASDPLASAEFLAGILGLAVSPPVAHFTPVVLANQVTTRSRGSGTRSSSTTPTLPAASPAKSTPATAPGEVFTSATPMGT